MTSERSIADDTQGAATVALDDEAPAPSTPAIERGTTFDRYVVLETIGRGGMGMVARAYDPKLQREVALKLLRSDGRGGRGTEASARLVREAQAMARLGHPNVVAVFDAGEVDGQVYLAMELVRGQTLRRWLETERPWREVLAVLREAGAGLVAAHAAGLVHRDFKPDNVLVGDDGRVRVTDFGIARGVGGDAPASAEAPSAPSPTPHALDTTSTTAHLTETGTILGTPPYMAPEQHRGEPADTRADQYAWCVTAWEALAGTRPFTGTGPALVLEKTRARPVAPVRSMVPTWIWTAIERGLDPDPERRWPSLGALLDALGHDASRRRRRRIGAAVIVGLAVGLAGMHALSRSRARARCRAEAEAIAIPWSADAKARLRDSVLAVPAGYAATTWDMLEPWLDDYAARWATLRESQCLASDLDRTRTAELRRLGDECLAERLDAFATLIDALADADEVALRGAVPSASKLPAIDACADDVRLAKRPRAPDESVGADEVAAVRSELRHAEIQTGLGRYADGLATARTALDRAVTLAWEPLVAEARVRVGMIASKAGDHATAERELLEGFLAAGRSGHDDVLADAALSLTYHVGYVAARGSEGMLWSRIAEMALQRAGDVDGLRGAELLSATGSVLLVMGEREEARVMYDRTLAIRERLLGSEHPDVATALQNVGTALHLSGSHREAMALFERGLAIQEKTLGAQHPAVAVGINNIAASHHALGEFAQARELQERALAIFEHALGPDHPDVALGLHNLATLAELDGDLDGAVSRYERALAIQQRASGADHPDVAMALHNLAHVHEKRGDRDLALTEQARAVDIFERALGPEHPDLVVALQGMADMTARRGDHDRVVELRERVVAILAKAPVPDVRQIAEAKLALAKALWQQGRERPRARELATDAANGLRTAGPEAATQLAVVEAWLRQTAESREGAPSRHR